MEATVPTPGIDDSIPSPAARPAPTRSPVANLPTASAPDMIAPRPGILFAINLPPTLAIPFVAAFLPTVFMIFFCAVLVCVTSLLAMSFLTFFTAGVFADPAFGNRFLLLFFRVSPVIFGLEPVRFFVTFTYGLFLLKLNVPDSSPKPLFILAILSLYSGPILSISTI